MQRNSCQVLQGASQICGTAFPGCSDRLESLSHFPKIWDSCPALHVCASGGKQTRQGVNSDEGLIEGVRQAGLELHRLGAGPSPHI